MYHYFTLVIIMLCFILPGCWQCSQADNQIATQDQNIAHKDLHLENMLDGKTGADRLREIISQGNVVVDFFASWCPPCKMMSPIVDQLAVAYGDKVTFVKVNIDIFSDITKGFNVGGKTIVVESYPQFYFFQNGTFKHHVIGGMDKDAFKNTIDTTFNLK